MHTTSSPRRLRRALAVAAAPLVVSAALSSGGCVAAGPSDGGGSAALTKSDKCGEIVDALCGALETCPGAGTGSKQQCEASIDCNTVVSVSPDWQACVADLAGASCTSIESQGVPPSCDQVMSFPGDQGPAEGAYELSFSGGTGGTCPVEPHTAEAGVVSASADESVVTDGQGAMVTCTVAGAGPFAVNDTLIEDGASVTVSIASIDANATMSTPAMGSLSYGGPETSGEPYGSSSCSFFFEGPESAAPGKIWV
ncbi:MAG TPA: hypothetical protein VHB21_28270, partial [Minicystis sp.]|nr:hypothetical protein [Minicystis sp.]